jgi:hypothetical protein
MTEPWTAEQVTGGPCAGSVHTIPVPRWMTVDQVWDTLRRGKTIEPNPECTWANVECPGGDDCECRTHPVADDYRHLHGGQVIYDHATTLALEAPS